MIQIALAFLTLLSSICSKAVTEIEMEDMRYTPGEINTHIRLVNVVVRGDMLYMRSDHGESSLVRWEKGIENQNWAFEFSFSNPALNADERAGIYLHYIDEKPYIGNFKGGESIFKGLVLGIEFLGKSVSLSFTHNEGNDYFELDEYVTRMDQLSTTYLRGVEMLTMKVIKTLKNIKFELYDGDRLLYDRFRIYDTEKYKLPTGKMYFGLATKYENVSSTKSFHLKGAKLYERTEGAEYDANKIEIENLEIKSRESVEIMHADSNVKELISYSEKVIEVVKSHLGTLPDTMINKAEIELSKELEQVTEKIKTLISMIKSKEKKTDWNHKMNDFNIKIQRMQKNVKDLDFLIPKLEKIQESGISPSYFIIISLGSAFLTFLAMKQYFGENIKK